MINKTSKYSVRNFLNGEGCLSKIEEEILKSLDPIEIDENEEISLLGQQGLWANKSESINWKGLLSLSDYSINEDDNPVVITKQSKNKLEYIQELVIRYLKPPTPPSSGDIIITKEPDVLHSPAPPLIIRQQPVRTATPEPIVIREIPPSPPLKSEQKHITISGKSIPPPPRKVVIERLATLPSKPPPVIIERWLPYTETKRKVIFNKKDNDSAKVLKPRNVIVQWEAPKMTLKRQVKYLGVISADPIKYLQKFGTSLKNARELPDFVLDIKTPDSMKLAAECRDVHVPELIGEVEALKLVDLNREGLNEYRNQVMGILPEPSPAASLLSESGRGSLPDSNI